MKEQANEKQERKLKDCFGWKIRHLNTRFIRVFKAPCLHVVVSENVFCQGMVVLLNPVCVLLAECFMFIRAKYVLQFSRRDDLQSYNCLDLYL